MPFYFAEITDITETTVFLRGSERRHLVDVMRVKKGALVTVTDGAGMTYECRVDRAGKKEAELSIIKVSRNRGEPRRRVTLAIGLSQSGKFDLILRMCTEIGVSGFAPLLSDRSKIKLESDERIKRKISRWREALKAALKQSERSRLPEIAAPQSLESYVRGLPQLVGSADRRIIAQPGAALTESRRGFDYLNEDDSPLIILVGPEAGFSPEELKIATSASFAPMGLGERTLRAETAAPALASLALLRP